MHITRAGLVYKIGNKFRESKWSFAVILCLVVRNGDKILALKRVSNCRNSCRVGTSPTGMYCIHI